MYKTKKYILYKYIYVEFSIKQHQHLPINKILWSVRKHFGRKTFD